jgi:hypothetical protein
LALTTAAGLAFVALKSLPAYHQHQRPVPDELAYLELGNEMAEAGGWSMFLQRCWTGEYRESNRHPLYLLILSSMAERDPAFYPRAKLASWLIALVSTGLMLVLAGRAAGPAGAALVALVLGHNDLWITHMCAVHVEMLLFVFVLAAWAVIAAAPKRIGWHVLAGAALGLAYLTKATTLILIAAYVLTLAVTRRCTVLRCPAVAALAVSAIVVASPLLVRNVRVFGDPVFNINSKYMWLDDWSQIDLVHEADLERLSARNFVERHGAAALGRRAIGGLAREGIYLCTALYPFNVRVTPLTVLAGAGVLAIGLWGAGGLEDRTGRWFTWFAVAGFLFALALHTPHGSHPRFQLTLLPMLYVTAALELSRWAARAGAAVRSSGTVRRASEVVGVLAACALGAVSLMAENEWPSAWPPRLLDAAPPPDSEQVLAGWLQTRLNDEDVLALADNAQFSPFWYRQIPGRYAVCPAGLDAAAFENWAARRKVTHAILRTTQPPRWAANWPQTVEPSPVAARAEWTLQTCVGPLCVYRRGD